jgi:triosephosphate isomerase
VSWTILGHSERRQYQLEDSTLIAKKTKLAIENKLSVMACIGEQLSDRETNKTFNVLESQLAPLKTELSEAQWANVVIAYEPVWAIGTGKTASTAQAQEVHAWIRGYVAKNVSSKVAQSVRILYGGSVTEKNSSDLIKQADIDGFLVGGAALKPAFSQIVDSCNNAKK